MEMILNATMGLLVGVLAAVMHLTLSWRAARGTVESGQSTLALALMPVRVIATALPIAALAWISNASVVAGLVGFAVCHRMLRARWPKEKAA